MNTRKSPPRWMQSLLERFADERTLEEVEGDLLEFYTEWLTKSGRTRANLSYLFTVITLLRPFKRRNPVQIQWIDMIKSYFVMSWRTIIKNKVSSTVNLLGLTLGLTTSLLIILVILKEFEYDQHHLKRDSIFLMMKNQRTNEGVSTGRSTAGPLAEALRSDYSQVAHASRVAYFHEVPLLSKELKVIGSGIYADPDIFSMMTFGVLKGNPAEALAKNSIVLSRSMATTLFGDLDPIGQSIAFNGSSLAVGAVIENIPATSTLKFQMAVPFRVFEKTNEWLVKWDDNRIQTWVELHSPADLVSFNKEVYSLVHEKTKDPNETLFAYPLAELHLRGRFSNGHPSGGLITVIWILGGFGGFMLLIACVNFMNIVTAQSAHRAKEVGIRKVLGAARRGIMLQFLNEALLLTFMSLIAAIGLSILLIPTFNLMMHTDIAFEFNKAIVWMLCLGVGLLTALLAGSYPAFFLSRFAPIRVLKEKFNNPGGMSLRRVLVAFQFVISISVLIGTIILYAQFDFVKSRPLGYEQQNLINIRLDSLSGAKFELVKNEVSRIPGVKSVTGTDGNILFSGGSVTGMDWPGRKPGDELAIALMHVEYDWTQTMGIDIVSGRDFNVQFASDKNACLLNETAVERMQLVNPVGCTVGGHPVIGVFRDFVFNNPSGQVAPMAVYLSPGTAQHLYIRIDNNNTWTETLSAVERSIKQVSLDLEFEFRFTDEEYQSQFNELSDVGLMVSIFGGMTIFISSLGLFGLSGFIAERRGKEMSIRKVFGADSIRILLSLSTDILKPVAIALLIVIPFSVWIAGIALEEFVYRVPLSWWMFAKASLFVFAISMMVVLYHGWKAARENPSVRLKSE